MVTRTDFQPLAADVVEALGGPDNISTFTHCATRLRFKVKNPDKADLKRAESIPGVLTALAAGGQHQVVIGNEVPLAYEAVVAVPGMRSKGIRDNDGGGEEDSGTETDKNLFNRFIDLISALFSPVIWCLAGIAIGKAFLSMFSQFGWIDPEGGNYIVFNAAFDGLFYFLPLFLALTAARKFKVNQFVALSVVAALLHPSIVTLAETGGSTLLGLPFPSMTYSSSVIPAIIAVWATGYLQRWLERVLPGAIRNFLTPLICVVIMVPLVLLTIGPATTWLSVAISDGIGYLFVTVPWLAGALMGGFWQVFTMFGLHWGFVPIFLNDISASGHTFLLAPLMAAVLAQAAATLAVFFVTRNPDRKKIAGPAAFSGFVAGVTEPAIYGVNLPLKVPFYMGLAGGAVGGAIIANSHNAATAFVFPSLLALPAFTSVGSFTVQLLGSGIAIAIGFFGTLVLARRAERKESESGAAAQDTAARDQATSQILLPVTGRVVPLEQINDKVFASGAMGQGIGVVPSSGTVTSPVTGTVIAVQSSGHAYGIKTDDGVEVLVHVGIDTVSLKGEGFTSLVTRGDRIAAGSPLVEVDLAGVEKQGFDTTTVLVVTNSAKLTAVTPVLGPDEAQAGTVALKVTV
ncbi:beta-glucoside-specific PTS transporter subunit IIABC [Corynebacterium pacaense]|uniref:beta-glucoside-specific PTS transporter subunit IIABC n=1 Tax=Corynebacterium pacaense TaxID=1816684 RepID=UPI0009B99AA6|nr:beta-glucoside-specific PTS transporter subunit IIABC [Corynebacterium pacaense]